jgi:hypothetical protein
MGRRDDRRRAQELMEREWQQQQQARPNEAPRRHRAAEYCGAALGKLHDYTMRGPDGLLRCWYCCQRPPKKA